MRQKKSPRRRTTITDDPQHRVTRSMTIRNLGLETNSVHKQHLEDRGNRGYSPSSSPRTKRSPRGPRTMRPKSRHVFPSTEATTFGLIQESIAHNLYFLVIQAILWNQTSGIQARPIFYALIERYPDPEHLSQASLADLTALLRPLGLHNIRARRCIALATCWTQSPPTAERRYLRKGYPSAGGRDRDPTSPPDSNRGFEIAHLPGVGPYALDSFRIFHRDEMRGLAEDWLGAGAAIEDGFEPEWKRVRPQDKELRAYLRWRWLKEGVSWDDEHGPSMPLSHGSLVAGTE